MSNKGLVTIVIPVYNVEKCLRECLDSIVAQDYSNLEIVLVNDGSSDNSGVIADEYVARDMRFISIHQKNRGVSAARNVGIEKATGEYIAFVDSDDYIREDFVERLVEDATKHSVSIVTTKKEASIEKNHIDSVEVFDRQDAFVRMFYGGLEKSQNGTQLFRRDLIIQNNIRFDTGKKIGEDFDFLVQAMLHCDRIAVDYNSMYYYRPNPTSAMNQSVNRGLMDAVDNFVSLGERLMIDYPGLQSAVEAKKFSDSVSLLVRSYHVQDEWVEDVEKLKRNVSSLRYQVALDRKAKKKIRLIATLYGLLGTNITTMILRRIKR